MELIDLFQLLFSTGLSQHQKNIFHSKNTHRKVQSKTEKEVLKRQEQGQ